MQNILSDFSAERLVKNAIKANWENYHYCLGRAPCVELSIGRYLTWFVTNMPDHFMNLVVCTDLPDDGLHELMASSLAHFRSLNIKKLTWLAEEGIPAAEIKKQLLAHGSIFSEAFSREMAADLMTLPEDLPYPNGLEIVPVENGETLQQWIHIASIGFGVPEEYEQVWYDFFVEAVFDLPFRTYLARLNGRPVATSQMFLSAGVAGIYNVTCIPEARGQGIGAAITLAPALAARGMGYRVAILQASDLGARVYHRLGFQDFGKRSIFLWEREVLK
jgi:GNAT superfamily N-acetyltransferase